MLGELPGGHACERRGSTGGLAELPGRPDSPTPGSRQRTAIHGNLDSASFAPLAAGEVRSSYEAGSGLAVG
jgi:hypothetical protein